MPRYEYTEGSSNKFWEIRLEGKSFVTTYGRIGTDGQSTLKEYKSEAEAKKEYEKLIAAKVKKGYVQVDGDGGGAEPAPKKTEKKTEKKAAKKAEKKAEQPAAAATAAPGGARYELVEGKSSKFWEIRLEGKSFVTTYGRIGTDGQSTMKEHSSPAEAKREHDKLVAAKVKKGYVLVSGGEPAAAAGPAAKQAANPELEAALLENPGNVEAYLVYADWLQTQGDVRGELISVQHALAQEDPKSDAAKKLKKAETDLLKAYPDHFLPKKLGEMLQKKRPGKSDWRHYMLETGFCDAEWHCGFLRSVRLGREVEEDPYELQELVADLFAHPSARFLVELKIGALGIADEYDYGEVVDAIAKAKPASLRRLRIADFMVEDSELSWSHLGNVSKLYKAMPRLEHLALRGGSMTLGTLDLPRLKSFRAETGGLDSASVKSVCNASWPDLESLHLYFGDENYGAGGSVKAIGPILEGKGLGQLRHLGLMNADFTDDICRALPASKILKQLETLDLSLGTMSDDGAAALAENKAALAHLKRIDVSDNFLTKKGMEFVKGLCAEVVTGKQKEPYDWDEDGRYVSVGE